MTGRLPEGRFRDWRHRLNDALAKHRKAPFRWGKHDCAILAADCIKAVVGDDLARGYRGKYRSSEAGLALMREAGFEDQVAMLASRYPEIAPAMARAGDVGVIEGPFGAALGVFDGPHIIVFALSGGLGRLPRTDAIKAFRIG